MKAEIRLEAHIRSYGSLYRMFVNNICVYLEKEEYEKLVKVFGRPRDSKGRFVKR